jgi:hypothetical protein
VSRAVRLAPSVFIRPGAMRCGSIELPLWAEAGPQRGAARGTNATGAAEAVVRISTAAAILELRGQAVNVKRVGLGVRSVLPVIRPEPESLLRGLDARFGDLAVTETGPAEVSCDAS